MFSVLCATSQQYIFVPSACVYWKHNSVEIWDGTRTGYRSLSPQLMTDHTVNKTHTHLYTYLGSAWGIAVSWGLIPRLIPDETNMLLLQWNHRTAICFIFRGTYLVLCFLIVKKRPTHNHTHFLLWNNIVDKHSTDIFTVAFLVSRKSRKMAVTLGPHLQTMCKGLHASLKQSTRATTKWWLSICFSISVVQLRNM